MRHEIQTITPKTAEKYLALNKNIRKLTKSWVQFFADTMTRGEFVLTPDGLCFDEHGNLVNGQHRLAAIVQSGVSVKMRVYYDITECELRAIDGGRKRHIADVLGADKKILETMTMAARICMGTPQFPVSVAENLYMGRPGDATTYLLETCRSTAKGFSSSAVKLAATVHMLDGADWSETAALYRALVLSDVDEMPPVAVSFTRQVFAGTADATRSYDLLARALAVFDPAKKDISRVTVGSAAEAAAREEVRRVVGPYVDGTDNERGER